MAFDVDRDGAQEDLIVDQALTYMEAFDWAHGVWTPCVEAQILIIQISPFNGATQLIHTNQSLVMDCQDNWPCYLDLLGPLKWLPGLWALAFLFKTQVGLIEWLFNPTGQDNQPNSSAT